MSNIYKVDYTVTIIDQIVGYEVVADSEEEAKKHVENMLNFPPVSSVDVTDVKYSHKWEDPRTDPQSSITRISDNMRKCAHERNPSNISEMHECACRKAAEKDE